MSVIGDMADRKDRPAHVRFERLAVEDVQASKLAGRFVGRDVDYALVTPPYSRDVFKTKVSSWMTDLKLKVQTDRMPKEWADFYEASYKAWLNGQALPLQGIPIKGWGVISPAQQETLIGMTILTVEDLAGMNDEAMRAIGMGAMALRDKANAWISQLNDKGPLTQEIAILKAENHRLAGTVETMSQHIQELKIKISMMGAAADQAAVLQSPAQIAVTDIFDEPAPVPKRASRKSPLTVVAPFDKL